MRALRASRLLLLRAACSQSVGDCGFELTREPRMHSESGQAEAFPMKGGVWRQSLSYEVHDVDGNPWFKLEGRVAPAGNSKRLVRHKEVNV